DRAVGGMRVFDPLTARITFRIALTDLGETSFLPLIVPGLAVAAPHCSLDVVALDIDRAPVDLVRGDIDLAVSSTPLRGDVRATAVRVDRYSCVARRGRLDAALDGGAPTLEALAALPRVVVRGSTGHTLVEAALPEPTEGSVFVPGFAAIPAILEASDHVAFVPHGITVGWARGRDLDVWPLPLDEFSTPVRAHRASTPPSASSAWFAAWATDAMRALPDARLQHP
ncbi:MAG: LysR substrate-binding domain-containing protein, partial [Pseudoclavibacter sp.]